MVQVMIVDDHRILADGLKKLINDSGFAQVAAIAYSGKECRETLRISKTLPDVLFLDINLPDASGIDLCKEFKNFYPSLSIVALTGFSEYAIVRQMLENGADGYVLKNAMPEEILLSIETVLKNQKFICHDIDMLMKKRSANPVWLTPRERELLKFIVNGYTNPEIAEKMFLGVETVNSYRKNLLLKLGAKNTAVLVRTAIEEKLI